MWNRKREESSSQSGAQGPNAGSFTGQTLDARYTDVTPPTGPFTGEIVAVHQHHSFVGKVRNGFETIAMKGDVYVPLTNFPVGAQVTFKELEQDTTRGEGCFKTRTCEELSKAVALPPKQQAAALAIRELTQARYTYGVPKQVDPDKAEQALKNAPFEDVLINVRTIEQLRAEAEQAGQPAPDMRAFAEGFLKQEFGSLEEHGVTYSIDPKDFDTEAEAAKIEESRNAFYGANMTSMAAALSEEYQKFTGIRRVFSTMSKFKLLNPQCIIPIRHLADLVMCAPVWFITDRGGNQFRSRQIDHGTHFFAELCSPQLAWLFQLYNYGSRNIDNFYGKDIMPASVLAVMNEARQVFDYTVIATPYHQLASNQWGTGMWQPNIDPFLFGFFRGLPYMFLLGRWSKTGLFPLVPDMIADTVDHLRVEGATLAKVPKFIEWINGSSPDNRHLETNSEPSSSSGRFAATESSNTVLPAFRDQIIRHFEAGTLFPFLRGELETVPAPAQ